MGMHLYNAMPLSLCVFICELNKVKDYLPRYNLPVVLINLIRRFSFNIWRIAFNIPPVKAAEGTKTIDANIASPSSYFGLAAVRVHNKLL